MDAPDNAYFYVGIKNPTISGEAIDGISYANAHGDTGHGILHLPEKGIAVHYKINSEKEGCEILTSEAFERLRSDLEGQITEGRGVKVSKRFGEILCETLESVNTLNKLGSDCEERERQQLIRQLTQSLSEIRDEQAKYFKTFYIEKFFK